MRIKVLISKRARLHSSATSSRRQAPCCQLPRSYQVMLEALLLLYGKDLFDLSIKAPSSTQTKGSRQDYVRIDRHASMQLSSRGVYRQGTGQNKKQSTGRAPRTETFIEASPFTCHFVRDILYLSARFIRDKSRVMVSSWKCCHTSFWRIWRDCYNTLRTPRPIQCQRVGRLCQSPMCRITRPSRTTRSPVASAEGYSPQRSVTPLRPAVMPKSSPTPPRGCSESAQACQAARAAARARLGGRGARCASEPAAVYAWQPFGASSRIPLARSSLGLTQ